MTDPSARRSRSIDRKLTVREQVDLDGISLRRQALDRMLWSFAVGLVDRFARHWLLLFNLSATLVLVGSLLVAYLRSVGAFWLAEPLSTAYLLLCPQRPSHSYFPFGSQMALEHREVAMFAAQLLGGLVYGLFRERLRPMHWRLMILLSLPMAWDGFSQMFGLRNSDWVTRTWTGGLFNLALVFWAYPFIERELRALRIEIRSTELGNVGS